MATKKQLEVAKLVEEYLEARLAGKPGDLEVYLRRCPAELREDVRLSLEGADFLLMSYEPLLRRPGGSEAAGRRIAELAAREEQIRAMEERLQTDSTPADSLTASGVLAFLSRITGASVAETGRPKSAAAMAPTILYRSKSKTGPGRGALDGLRAAAALSRAKNVARRLLAEAGASELPIDPYRVARAHNVLVIEREAEGCDGCILVEGDAAAILVNAGIRKAERRRFTVAHELGHFALHREMLYFRRESLEEIEGEFDAGIEAEANAFASELLMPAASVDYEFATQEPSWFVVDQMQARYSVSLTAAALRLVKSSHYSCALAFIRDGMITWVARSPEWRRYYLAVGGPPREGTLAASVLAGAETPQKAQPVSASAWAPEHTGEDAELLEAARVIYEDSVLVLLYDQDAG